jgi:predicted N-acyltransferase
VGLAQHPCGRANVSLISALSSIPAAEWDALFDPGYPFTRHAFLKALEDNGCVSAENGWQSCHWMERDRQNQLIAAAPLYLKTHSYGEFVFDFAWAQASHRAGQRYYPKLLCAVPFTPSIGPRLGAHNEAARHALAQHLTALPGQLSASSAHTLFLNDLDSESLRDQSWLERCDVQFHWYNAEYASFEDFLARLNAHKRKKILRERRRITESGLRFEVKPGHTLNEAQWAEVYALYANTYEERGQAPYLTLAFFLDYGSRADTPIRLILAYEQQTLVAMALTLQGVDTLYGRHWGAAANYHSLHFETCYYQGIEYCIREKLARYDAGTQGEHKHGRGFAPVLTRSMHHIVEPRLSSAVEHYLRRETKLVKERYENLVQNSPYRQD